MEWIAALRGQIVGLDTAPIIYFLEEHPAYLETVRPFFQGVDQGEYRIVTSTVTLLEVLVQPLRQGNSILADQYREILLNSDSVSCVPVSSVIAERAAHLRSEYNFRRLDAIQAATAITEGAATFFTNDARLPSLPELQMLQLDQLRP